MVHRLIMTPHHQPSFRLLVQFFFFFFLGEGTNSESGLLLLRKHKPAFSPNKFRDPFLFKIKQLLATGYFHLHLIFPPVSLMIIISCQALYAHVRYQAGGTTKYKKKACNKKGYHDGLAQRLQNRPKQMRPVEQSNAQNLHHLTQLRLNQR